MSENFSKSINTTFIKKEPKKIIIDNNSSNEQIPKTVVLQKSQKTKKQQSNLNNSFSKEFTNLSFEANQEDEESTLSQSCCFNDLNNIKNENLHEPSDIILDHYLYSKNLKNAYKKVQIKKKSIIIKPEEISSLKDNNILKNQINNNDEFLSPRKLQKIDKDIFNKNLRNLNDENGLKQLYEVIKKVNYKLNFENSDNNIGPLCTLEDLFDIEYKNIPQYMNDQNINKKFYNFANIIYRYRQVKGDGNCFYRAVIFRYIETIILNKNVNLFKNILIDMQKCFNSSEIQKRIYIKFNTTFKPELHLKIMCLILHFLEKNDIKTSHELFIKCILSCKIFDYGLILYFRYILYLYIKNNENKLYLKIFPVKIGNLLPSIYENEKGEFEFNKFYEKYLLKMFTEAEKIIIYLTPFVLNIDLDIILFYDSEEEIIYKIPYLYEKEINEFDQEKIILLNSNEHYKIIYNEKNYVKNKNIFENYELEKSDKLLLSCDSGFFLLKDEDTSKKIQSNKMMNKDNNISVDNQNMNNSIRNKYKLQQSLKENNTNNNNNTAILKKPQRYLEHEKNEKKPNNFNNEILKNNINNQENNKKNKDNNISVDMASSQIISQKILPNKEINYKINKKTNNTKIINENNELKKNINESVDIKEIANIHVTEEKKPLDNNRNRKMYINLFTDTPFGHPKYDCDENLLEKLDNMFPSPNTTSNNKRLNKTTNQNNNNNDLSFKTNNKQLNDINNNIKSLCNKCHKINVNSNYHDYLLCDYCLKNIIIDSLKLNYTKYINTINKNLFSDDKNIRASYYYELFDDNFKTNKFNINKIKVSYQKIIEILNHLTNLNEEKIIKEIKKNVCLSCAKTISPEKNIMLPCDCLICIKEIKKYFEEKNPIHPHFVCPCLFMYSSQDFYKLCDIFYKNQCEQLIWNIINFFSKEFLNKGCCICGKELKTEKNKIEYNVKETNEFFFELYATMEHFVCKNCLVNIKSVKMRDFRCFYCGKEHLLALKY